MSPHSPPPPLPDRTAPASQDQADLETCAPRTWRSRRRPLVRPLGRRGRIDGLAPGSPLPPPPPPDLQVSPGLGGWAGTRGRGGGEGGGARAAPLKRAAAGAGAAQPRSEPETGRACVCLCFARARSSASRGVAAKFCGAFGSSTGPWPCRLRAPPLPHSQRRGPNWQLLSPLFARGPRGRTWVRVQTGPCHFQKKEKTGRGTGSSAGVCKGSSRTRTATLGFCAVYFLTDVVPSTHFPVKDKGRGQVET